MRIRNIIITVFVLVFALLLVGCQGGKDKTKTTYDENGNLVREEYYNDNGKLEEYATFEYNENNILKLKKNFDAEDTMTSYVEYEYHANGSKSSENTVWVDPSGKQTDRVLVTFYESGNRHEVSNFNANDGLIMKSVYNESGICTFSENLEYDESGVLKGRHVHEQDGKGLTTRDDYYDSSNKLITGSTYSYHSNGVMKESKTVNGNGDVISHVIVNENDEEIYREMNSFHDNGKMSENNKLETKDGILYGTVIKYDESGKLITRELSESTKEKPIKNEIYDANDELIYFKDATRLEEKLFASDGTHIGDHFIEYFASGDTKLEKEITADGKLSFLYEYSENGVLLKNESYKYNASGAVIESHYEEISESDVLLKSEIIKFDDNGNVIDKTLALYDNLGNVTFSENIEGGVLKHKFTAEYYGYEKPKREESYNNDGISVQTRILEYDEAGRTVYRYDCREDPKTAAKIEEILEKTRYNSAGVIVYHEQKSSISGGSHTIEEFYDNGNIKKRESTGEEGRRYSLEEYAENGTRTRSLSINYDQSGRVLDENEEALVDGKLVSRRVMNRYGDNGVLVRSDIEENGQLTVKEYYDSGELYTVTKYHGTSMDLRQSFEKFAKDGTRTAYSENNEKGNPTYSYEVMTDGFIREARYEYYNGDVVKRAEIRTKDGTEIREYYENERPKMIAVYAASGQLLDYTEFHENGEIKKRLVYELDGTLVSDMEWDENGNPIRGFS